MPTCTNGRHSGSLEIQPLRTWISCSWNTVITLFVMSNDSHREVVHLSCQLFVLEKSTDDLALGGPVEERNISLKVSVIVR